MNMQISGPVITDADIQAFEAKYRLSLPRDYQSFLKDSNGGYPVDEWSFGFYERAFNAYTGSLIQEFCTLYPEDNPEYNNLGQRYAEFVESGQVPPSLIPIAFDPGGNFIMLCVSDKDYGKVCFANHELEDTETRYMVMSPIADSFTEFINKLYIEE